MFKLLLTGLILNTSQLVSAQQCTATFPSGASSFDSNGSIQFGFGAQLINSGTVIDAMTITSSQANGNTCFSGPCISSGETSSGLTLPDFEESTSNSNVTINNDQSQSVTTGDYRNIRLRDRATVTFVGNDVTRIDFLQTRSDGDIILTGGIYFIDRLILGDRTNIMVPSGCLLYTSPSPRDLSTSRMPSSA